MNFPTTGLYAITQTENHSDQDIVDAVAAAFRGGAKVLQYRDKRPQPGDDLAKTLLQCCHEHNAPLLINDDIELARRISADGVHLGKDDGSISQARDYLGAHAIIGASCYNSLELAHTAQQQQADYVAFGRFFSSGTKPLASPADLDTLTQAKQELDLPIVAIGGILPENGTALLAAGADLLAVIGGLFDQNPEPAARAYGRLFRSE